MGRVNSNSPLAASDTAPDEGTISLRRIERLRGSLPGKDSLIDELIDLFVSDLPGRLAAITQAIQCADARALLLHAHALRGGAANFGACRLDELCEKLEEIGERGVLGEAPAMLDGLERASVEVRDALLALKSKRPAESAPAAARRAQKSSGSSRKLW
jgi:HPt (histidine-containing phosphotransfer) domain-containing protein